jgi:hypothetical protein
MLKRSWRRIRQIKQLQVQLQQAEAEKALSKKAVENQLQEKQLATDRALFNLEKQQTVEAINNRSNAENTKLDSKRQLAAVESKISKADKTAADKAGGKVDAGMQTIAQLIAAISKGHMDTATQMQQLMTAIAAPRKRTAIRSKDGRLEGSVDEMVQ